MKPIAWCLPMSVDALFMWMFALYRPTQKNESHPVRKLVKLNEITPPEFNSYSYQGFTFKIIFIVTIFSATGDAEKPSEGSK